MVTDEPVPSGDAAGVCTQLNVARWLFAHQGVTEATMPVLGEAGLRVAVAANLRRVHAGVVHASR